MVIHLEDGIVDPDLDAWISTDFGRLDPDSDPSGQKRPTKKKKGKKMFYVEVPDVLF
jgi:hypothetical protein